MNECEPRTTHSLNASAEWRLNKSKQGASWQQEKPLNLIREALPKEQHDTHSRTWGCVGREGPREGRGRLPGISVLLSSPLDVTGQMAQWPLRSLTVLKLSTHSQNRFDFTGNHLASANHAPPATNKAHHLRLNVSKVPQVSWMRASTRLQSVTGQQKGQSP